MDRTIIDTWVDSHVTFNSSWEQQIEDLCKFPGLENKESLVEETLEKYLEEDRDTPYTDTVVDILNKKENQDA